MFIVELLAGLLAGALVRGYLTHGRRLGSEVGAVAVVVLAILAVALPWGWETRVATAGGLSMGLLVAVSAGGIRAGEDG